MAYTKTAITPEQMERISNSMSEVLDNMPTLNADTPWDKNPSMQDTPKRFAKYLAEYCQPIDLEKIFGSMFVAEDDHNAMVIQANIPFRMVCEHHLLPATGKAAIGYVPNGKVIGLSKLSRLIDAVGTERPSLQEHIVDRVMALMKEHLDPKGCMVVVKATHGCMACRGINKPGVVTTSSAVSGIFRDVSTARQEMLNLIQHEMKCEAM